MVKADLLDRGGLMHIRELFDLTGKVVIVTGGKRVRQRDNHRVRRGRGEGGGNSYNYEVGSNHLPRFS